MLKQLALSLLLLVAQTEAFLGKLHPKEFFFSSI
jgi:hypothetical protein